MTQEQPSAAERNTQGQALAAIRQSAATPWLIDLYAGMSLAGVVVFNAAGSHIALRIIFLILLLIALFLETRYAADAQARSDRFLMLTLAGMVFGMILSVFVAIAGLAYSDEQWMVWTLFGVLTLVSFGVARLFRFLSDKLVTKRVDDADISPTEVAPETSDASATSDNVTTMDNTAVDQEHHRPDVPPTQSTQQSDNA